MQDFTERLRAKEEEEEEMGYVVLCVPWAMDIIAQGYKCVGLWSITMVATQSPQKACDPHVTSLIY